MLNPDEWSKVDWLWRDNMDYKPGESSPKSDNLPLKLYIPPRINSPGIQLNPESRSVFLEIRVPQRSDSLSSCSRRAPSALRGCVGQHHMAHRVVMITIIIWSVVWNIFFHRLGIIIPTDELHHFSEG